MGSSASVCIAGWFTNLALLYASVWSVASSISMLFFPSGFWVYLIEPGEAQFQVVSSAFHGIEGFVVDDRSDFEEERRLVLDRAGVVGRSIYVVDLEGFYESFWFTKLGLVCSPGLAASNFQQFSESIDTVN